MDGTTFDKMVKSVAKSNRRSFVKGATAVAFGAFAGVGLKEVHASRMLRRSGELCRKSSECQSGICLPKDKTGRTRCG